MNEGKVLCTVLTPGMKAKFSLCSALTPWMTVRAKPLDSESGLSRVTVALQFGSPLTYEIFSVLQAWRSLVRFPVGSLDFSNPLIHSIRTMALGSTQSLKKISTKDVLGGKEWEARKADNFISSVSRFPREYGMLDISQSYGPPRPFLPGLALSAFGCRVLTIHVRVQNTF
jgi:hypothetical protein